MSTIVTNDHVTSILGNVSNTWIGAYVEDVEDFIKIGFDL